MNSSSYRRREGSTVVQAIDPPSPEVQALWDDLSRAIGRIEAHIVLDKLSRTGDWTLRGLLHHYRAGQLR